MNDAILTYDKLNKDEFQKKYPTNILNIHIYDIFKNSKKADKKKYLHLIQFTTNSNQYHHPIELKQKKKFVN